MLIKVTVEDKRPIVIPVPTRLLTSRAGIRYLSRKAVKYVPQQEGEEAPALTSAQVDSLAEAFRRVREMYGRFTLVEVEADGGETRVEITL